MFAPAPVLWDREAQEFASAATSFELERQMNWIEHDSVDSFADVFMDRFPLSR
jgi:hypothetical protein